VNLTNKDLDGSGHRWPEGVQDGTEPGIVAGVVAPRWTVAQIGHREEYAAARFFAAEGRLARLYNDIWCRHGARVLQRGPTPFRRFSLRHHPTLQHERVVAWSPTSAAHRVLCAARMRGQPGAGREVALRHGAWFDAKVARRLGRLSLDPENDAFFSFNLGCLETLRHLRARGVTALVDQFDPARVEYDLVRAEAERWPGWQAAPTVIPEAYFERVRAEWEAAAGVVVNSAWSADALVRQGVPRERIVIVPLAYEPRVRLHEPRPRNDGPLRVLWLGNVILRKGIQYLIEAARLLSDRSIRIVVVGPVRISERAVRSAPSSVEFRGEVTHDRISDEYADADVFVLPTLSDGFGLTQLEAMAHGLPVVTTPNCGPVVDHGHDGLVVPAADADALADALATLDDDRDMVESMSKQSLVKAAQFSLERYGAGLDAAAERFALGPNARRG
jgi:glycosyltransferase involved in cell wall biosynthesis